MAVAVAVAVAVPVAVVIEVDTTDHRMLATSRFPVESHSFLQASRGINISIRRMPCFALVEGAHL